MDSKKHMPGEGETEPFEMSAQTRITDDDAQRIEDEKESNVADADTENSEESDSE